MFSKATIEDYKEISKLEIPFSFGKNLKEELTKPDQYRWIILKENSSIQAFHRSILLDGTGYLGGIFSKKSNHKILYELLKYSIEDLSNLSPNGLIAWDSFPETAKFTLLKKFEFKKNIKPIIRIFFEYKSVVELVKIKESYLDEWIVPTQDELRNFLFNLNSNLKNQNFIQTNWLIGRKAGVNYCAVCWWNNGIFTELLFSVSYDATLDITGSLKYIIKHTNSKRPFILKINLEEERKISFLKLLRFNPKTYKEGF